MSSLTVSNAPKGYAVLPFYATAAIFFVVFAVLFLISGDYLFGHHFQPKVLTLVHTLALGWGSMIIFGSAYQLVPVIFNRDLYSSKLAFITYVLLTIGTCLLIHSFWSFSIGWMMITGGILITLSSYLYFFVIWSTIKKSSELLSINLFFTFSAFWLCVTTTIGLLLAINLKIGFFNRNHLEILKLHAHAGFAGWFLQLILGAGAKMIPMFLLGKSSKGKLLLVSVVFVNIGLLLFLFDGFLHEVGNRSLWFAILVFIGFISWLIYIGDCVKNRVRKKIDIAMKHSLLSFVCLLLAFSILPWVIKLSSGIFITIYVVLILLGWITGIILGMTFKTLPFIIWNLRYKEQNGEPKVPMPKDLYNQKILRIQFYSFCISISIIIVAVFLNSTFLLKIALWSWLFMTLCYVYNIVKIFYSKLI